MRRQRLQLIVLAVVLAVLAVGYFILRQYNKAQSEKPEEPAGEAIVEVSQDDIVKLSYDYEGNRYEYEKEDGIWYYVLNHDLNLTQYRLENMAEELAGLTALETISDVTDLTQYGLDEPSRTLAFETAGESFIFNVGDYNEIAGVYYICRPSTTTVYAVDPSLVTAFDVDVLDMAEEESTEENTGESTAENAGENTEQSAEDSARESMDGSAGEGAAESIEGSPEAGTEASAE